MAKKIRLKNKSQLIKLDRRSAALTIKFFSHRIDLFGFSDQGEFINWARENLGDFLPWNIFYCNNHKENFIAPNWAIRYQSVGLVHTEIFLQEKVVPFVMLHWQDNG